MTGGIGIIKSINSGAESCLKNRVNARANIIDLYKWLIQDLTYHSLYKDAIDNFLGFLFDGVFLICDCGTNLQAASPCEHNYFGASAQDSTSFVEGATINLFSSTVYLRVLSNDVRNKLRTRRIDLLLTLCRVRHEGFACLPDPVFGTRVMVCQYVNGRLLLEDRFEVKSPHRMRTSVCAAPDVRVKLQKNLARFNVKRRPSQMRCAGSNNWKVSQLTDRVSSSYGYAHAIEFQKFDIVGLPVPLRWTLEMML